MGVALVELLVIASLSSWWSASAPVGAPLPAAALLGVVVAAAGLPLRVGLQLWRELRHEPRRGLPTTRPGDDAGSEGLAGSTAGVVPARRSSAVLAVVIIDQVVQALARAATIGAAAFAVHWWVGARWPVALVVVPVLGAVLRRPIELVAWWWRRRLDDLEVVPRSAWPSALAALGPPWPPVLFDLFRTGRRAARRGEGGYVVRGPTRARLVLDGDLFGAPPAELAAVAAHELGHVQTIRYGLAAAGRRGMAVAGVVALAGLGARLAVPAGLVGAEGATGHPAIGPWAVAAVLAVDLLVLAPLSALWARRVEAAADRFAATRLADGRASAMAVRRRLLADGVDIAPCGLRRLLARYPDAAQRLDLLDSCSSATGHRNVTVPSAPLPSSAPRIDP